MKMKTKRTEQILQKEFADFCGSELETPKSLNAALFDRLSHEEWSPARGRILAKIILIQLAISIVSLTFCPQFDYSLTNSYALFHFFHHTFGEVICMLLCSSIFTGLGALISSFILRPGEFAAIKTSGPLLFISYTGVALVAFMMMGADIFAQLTFYWAMGSIASGILFFYLPQKMIIPIFARN